MDRPFRSRRSHTWRLAVAGAAALVLFAAVLLALSLGGHGIQVLDSQRSAAPAADVVSLTIHLSNQSYRNPWIAVRLQLDGREILKTRLFVGRQHLRKTFKLDVSPGTHTVRIDREGSEVGLAKEFEATGRRWMSINYWYREGDTTPHFTFDVQPVPIAFD